MTILCKGPALALTLIGAGLVLSHSISGDLPRGPSSAGAAMSAPESMAVAPTSQEAGAGSAAEETGDLLVKFRPESGLGPALANMLVGAEEVGRIDSLGVVKLKTGPGMPPDAAARFYQGLPIVEYAEPNYRVQAAAAPDDPLYALRQQGYYSVIEAPQAWDLQAGSPSIVVAVLDTGVDVDHPDLKDQIWRNPNEVPDNGIDDDHNGCVDDVNGCNFVDPEDVDQSCDTNGPAPNNQIQDDDGHGTFVAGVIGAGTDNSLGVAGGGRGVSVMPVKVLDCTGTGTVADVAAGIVYAAKMGASVINLSFGGEDDSSILRDAVQRAYDNLATVLVAPTGNEGTRGVFYPARYPEVVAVAALGLNSADSRASFSNWGPEVEVAAPGVEIVSTVPPELCGERWECFDGQPYAPGSGSSFASAHVSALAGLMLSRNPLLTPDELREIIRATAIPLPDGLNSNWDGAGRIQMMAALKDVPYRIGVAGVNKG
jgi:subtilisin family serine protease